MPPTNEEWPEPRWVFVHKHHALGASREEIIASSRGRDGDSRYSISREEVKQLELAIIAVPGAEISPRKRPLERHFWGARVDEIGASKGEPTKYFYVTYNYSGGFVHGYPITRDELATITEVTI